MASLGYIRRKLHEVISSPYSTFYADIYRGKINIAEDFPRTWAAWESIPPISKIDLMRVPYEKRTFIPLNELERIHQSSGTTGVGLVIVPKPDIPYIEEFTERARMTSFIGFMYPHAINTKFIRPGCAFIGGDPARLEASAALAAAMHIDGIAAGTASIIIEFAPVLEKRYNLSKIKTLFVQTDVCRDAHRIILHKYFPNAKIVMMYASAEMQPPIILSAIPPIEGFPSAVEAPMNTHHFDLIDTDGHPIHETGVAGELVVSIFYDGMALPLVRYRPGDRAVMHIRTDDRTVFTVLGRTSGNPIRLSVGEIVQEEIERALEAVAPAMIEDFEARVRSTTGTTVPHLDIRIVPRPGTAFDDVQLLARNIESELHITEQRTYTDGIARGACMPITVSIVVKDGPPGWNKRQRLLDDRDSQ